jgi:hypothetical protein
MQTHTCYSGIKIKLQCAGDRRDTCRQEQMHMRARGHEAAPCTMTGGQYSRDILHLRISAALGNCNSAMSGDVMIPIPQGRMVLDSVLETRQPLLPLQTAPTPQKLHSNGLDL